MAIGSMGAGLGASSYNIALSGMRDATLRLDVAAHNIANSNTNGFVPDRVSSQAQASGGVKSYLESSIFLFLQGTSEADLSPSQTDLTTELVNTLTAKYAFEANAKLLKAQDEAEESLINMVA